MHFTKMHGLGNDYLYHYGEIESPQEISIKLSDRHFGIGSDGIIIISPSEVADCKMRIFNADGSEAKMCGNGIRCVGKFVFDKGIVNKTHITVETLSGIRSLDLQTRDNRAISASVDMGKVVASEKTTIATSFGDISIMPVSVGNPHGVIFTGDAENAPLTTLGKEIENHSFFPGGVNVEFVQVIAPNTLRMRVWERGSGITMACGTGACASAFASVKAGLCDRKLPITVKLDGGDLKISVLGDDTVIMTGPATTVCECEVEL